jgi:hypothetical protein
MALLFRRWHLKKGIGGYLGMMYGSSTVSTVCQYKNLGLMDIPDVAM